MYIHTIDTKNTNFIVNVLLFPLVVYCWLDGLAEKKAECIKCVLFLLNYAIIKAKFRGKLIGDIIIIIRIFDQGTKFALVKYG